MKSYNFIHFIGSDYLESLKYFKYIFPNTQYGRPDNFYEWIYVMDEVKEWIEGGCKLFDYRQIKSV